MATKEGDREERSTVYCTLTCGASFLFVRLVLVEKQSAHPLQQELSLVTLDMICRHLSSIHNIIAVETI